MSFLDKVKQAAEKAAEGAKKGTAQVKEKIELGQLRKKADEDAKELGYLIVRERSEGAPAGAEAAAVVSGPDRVREFLDPSVRLVEGPGRTLAGIEASTPRGLRGMRTTRAAGRLLENAMSGAGSAPEAIREAVTAVGSSDLT